MPAAGGVVEGAPLGVSLAGHVPALADDPLVRDQDAADAGFGRVVPAAPGQLDRTLHEVAVHGLAHAGRAHRSFRRRRSATAAVRVGRRLEPFDLLAKGVDVLETAIHRGEADVGHLVEFAQFRSPSPS